MEVECSIHCNEFKSPDNTSGNKILYIKNESGYHNVKIWIKEFVDNNWVVRGEASVDGCTLIKAVNNAMND